MSPPGSMRLVPCPENGCAVRFSCDACLHEHLRTVHRTTYGSVFGDVPEAWMELCPGHGDFPPHRLLVDEPNDARRRLN